ncbi:MAG: hypothetical protein QOE70_5932 [Chthoniobacter sp.]|jgi:hypothetical protein|nr:hypothetical protein [Chthoniobacter sp.]
MKSFRFPLEVVLEARTAQETEARRQLALALEKQRAAMARSREAGHALNLLLQAIATESAGRFSTASRERSWAMREAQEKICAELRAVEQECIRGTGEKRAAVLQARRNRELLESLKGTRREAWEKEAAAAEQHQFDEFAMTRRHQTSQREPAALC